VGLGRRLLDTQGSGAGSASASPHEFCMGRPGRARPGQSADIAEAHRPPAFPGAIFLASRPVGDAGPGSARGHVSQMTKRTKRAGGLETACRKLRMTRFALAEGADPPLLRRSILKIEAAGRGLQQSRDAFPSTNCRCRRPPINTTGLSRPPLIETNPSSTPLRRQNDFLEAGGRRFWGTCWRGLEVHRAHEQAAR